MINADERSEGGFCMKITCIQMDMLFAQPEVNFPLAEKLIREAAEAQPDVIVLPETWNVGFFPKKDPASLFDKNCEMTKKRIGALAKELRVNIVAGSVADLRGGRSFNTACIFDRSGGCIAQYDKTHLFSPMGEQLYFTPGDRLCRFMLDGAVCGVVICYDVRFPELTRALRLGGMEVLFIVSQWPDVRISQLRTLVAARAVENQAFAVLCNSCGTAEDTKFGGFSCIVDPFGQMLAEADEKPCRISADCDLGSLREIRSAIPVMNDRRPELYL